jgi:hypothetical protein
MALVDEDVICAVEDIKGQVRDRADGEWLRMACGSFYAERSYVGEGWLASLEKALK